MKYRPEFPDHFDSIEDARAFCADFFRWYNQEHHHSGIALMSPETVHYGMAESVRETRGISLQRAYQLHPERFVRKQPQPPRLTNAVWINPPEAASKTKRLLNN